jgi:hypothetical protein
VEPVARVAGGGAGVTPGARSTAVVEQWLTDLAPGAQVTLTPVVDLTARYAVNAYEVPDRLRTQVEHRDDHGCRFPWCGRTGRYDLDHIDPYQWTDPDHPDEPDPPPGQTSTDNLARLCRFHHRVKTHTTWTYQRDPDPDPGGPGSDVLRWTSPLGRRYTVDETGTYPQD